jgi:acyl carrier protein
MIITINNKSAIVAFYLLLITSLAMTAELAATQEKIKNYIVQTSHADANKIKNESLIFKEGFFDSMGFIMLITFLEEEFGIKTQDSDLIEENFESINAITDFIQRKKAA